jgi:inositol 1,4,5-triphosphate receptor type 3
VTKFLSDYSKKSFEEKVNRESANDKIKDLLTHYSDFFEEMSHFQKLNAMGIPVNLTYFEWLKNISLVVVITANITLLWSNTSTNNKFGDSLSDRFIEILGFIIMIIYLVIGGLWLLFNSHIDIMRTHRKSLPKFIKIQQIDSPFKRSISMFGYFRDFFFSLLVNTYVLDLSMNITFAMLGVYYSKVFFSFMLLDIISRSDLLKNVIRSVTLNIGQFVMTGILGVILIWIFTSMTYFTSMKSTTIFVEDPTFSMCSNYPHCFLTFLGFGMRSGGGIGEQIFYPDYQSETSDYWIRFLNDFLFFVLISIIYLNILFGIIIDTFAELRDQKNVNGKHQTHPF